MHLFRKTIYLLRIFQSLLLCTRYQWLKRRHLFLQIHIVRCQLEISLLKLKMFRIEDAYQALNLASFGSRLPVFDAVNEPGEERVKSGDCGDRLGHGTFLPNDQDLRCAAGWRAGCSAVGMTAKAIRSGHLCVPATGVN